MQWLSRPCYCTLSWTYPVSDVHTGILKLLYAVCALVLSNSHGSHSLLFLLGGRYLTVSNLTYSCGGLGDRTSSKTILLFFTLAPDKCLDSTQSCHNGPLPQPSKLLSHLTTLILQLLTVTHTNTQIIYIYIYIYIYTFHT